MLNEDVRKIIAQANLAFVATVNGDGSPNVSPKSTLRPHGENCLIFANLSSPRTVMNLKRDPRIEINCVDIFSRRGYRFSGSASLHHPGDLLYEELNTVLAAELGEETEIYHAVLVEVEKVREILSPAYYKANITEKKLREKYLKKYGVVQ